MDGVVAYSFSKIYYTKKEEEECVVIEKQKITKRVKSLLSRDTQTNIRMDMDHSDREKAGYKEEKKYLDLEHHSFSYRK
jgi:3-isopropylmalate dehydratase small subunit